MVLWISTHEFIQWMKRFLDKKFQSLWLCPTSLHIFYTYHHHYINTIAILCFHSFYYLHYHPLGLEPFRFNSDFFVLVVPPLCHLFLSLQWRYMAKILHAAPNQNQWIITYIYFVLFYLFERTDDIIEIIMGKILFTIELSRR